MSTLRQVLITYLLLIYITSIIIVLHIGYIVIVEHIGNVVRMSVSGYRG